jgi:polygalacturonase
MVLNVSTYPVDPSGVHLSSPAINRAIEDCAAMGGGTVEIPAGRYLCGTIELQSYVTLHLHPGAVLLGSEDIADYHGSTRGCPWGWMGAPEALTALNTTNPCPALILADRKTHVGITGAGTIDGQRSFTHGYTEKKGRPFLIVLS